MKAILFSLTDDPFDPPGVGRYGGAQIFMFNLCRSLIQRGGHVTLVTRKSRPDKPKTQDMGPCLRIYRLDVGPEWETSHHDLWESKQLLISQACDITSKEPFDLTLSMNWLSGLMALEAGVKPHFHHLLSLGRVRRELNEEEHPSDAVRDQGEIEVFQGATRLICVCRDELLALKRLYPEVDHAKAVIIPYLVEENAFTRRPMDPRNFLRWQTERFTKGV